MIQSGGRLAGRRLRRRGRSTTARRCGDRQQEQRMIADLDEEARVDLIFVEVRVAGARRTCDLAGRRRSRASRAPSCWLGKTQWKR